MDFLRSEIEQTMRRAGTESIPQRSTSGIDWGFMFHKEDMIQAIYDECRYNIKSWGATNIVSDYRNTIIGITLYFESEKERDRDTIIQFFKRLPSTIQKLIINECKNKGLYAIELLFMDIPDYGKISDFERKTEIVVMELMKISDKTSTRHKPREENPTIVFATPSVITPLKKSVFITYCWEIDDSSHKTWVHKLAKDLQNAGFDIIIDIKQSLGTEINRFMEQTIKKADKVLIIATPEYKKRADDREGGVGYETTLITNDLINEQNRIKFIPLIRKGKKETCFPIYLGNRKGLSIGEIDNYENALNELIENINNH